MQYSLNVINHSLMSGSACVYQESPNLAQQGFMKLAWFTKAMHPETQSAFQWNVDYSFVWAETGKLSSGVLFLASQVVSADLSTKNRISLDYSGGAYYFQTPAIQGPQQGNLYIDESPNIPSANTTSVGVGMSGYGTFAAQAGPNLSAVYTPHPTYYITFGTYEQGQVMDATISTPCAEIKFPPNVYSMTAILGADNKWTIQTTADANAKFIGAKKKNPEILYAEALV